MARIISDLKTLSKSDIELIKAAREVAPNAYNKYSQFYVGAAVRTKSGNIYKGTFLDNVSTGLTICAEPAAIMNANTNGDFNVETIAVVGGADINGGDQPVTPCGRCRQIIFEASQVSNKDIIIYSCNMNLTKILISKISELLPFPFLRDD